MNFPSTAYDFMPACRLLLIDARQRLCTLAARQNNKHNQKKNFQLHRIII
jgi:hypothetical protein